MAQAFDEYAERYDGWFLANPAVLESEVRLIKHCLGPTPGRTLSVGCGSGLFELILRRDHGVEIAQGVEPAESMAAIARRRGLAVQIGRAEELPFGNGVFDTVLFNGTPSYIADLSRALAEAHRVLRPQGLVVVADVPRESSYALLYELAVARGTWQYPTFEGVAPRFPYPVEFAAAAHWRTTPEKVGLLEKAGFMQLTFAQTLTRHPVYSNDSVETPSEGFDRGDYVAICAYKPARAA